jgi:hypothetical protein
MRWDGQMSANTWALTLVLHRTQRVADEAINRALDGILILAAFLGFKISFQRGKRPPGSCNNTLRRPLRHGAQRPRTSGGRPAALRVTGDAARRLRPTFLRSPHVARVVGRHRRPRGKRPGRASGGRPAALHVTDDTARHLRYTSRAKREADVSLSHRCTMEHPVAPWSTTMRRVLPPRDRR